MRGEAGEVDSVLAAQERERYHRRAGPQLLPALRPMLRDPAAELVPEDDRLHGVPEAVIADLLGRLGPLVDPVARVQVRSADPAANHLYPHLAGPGIGFGTLDQVELTVLAGDRSHPARLSSHAKLLRRTFTVRRCREASVGTSSSRAASIRVMRRICGICGGPCPVEVGTHDAEPSRNG